ncbi:MAG: hypothetical protein LC623_02115, partial [Halobacteriales archaeon]|nr:hypothetical protein [Halobacteriales archaeon]
HSSAHATQAPSRANTKRIGIQWSTKVDQGHLEAEVDLALEVDDVEKIPRQKRDQARRYLLAHQSNVFLALHSAVRQCAGWTGIELNDDFERLGKISMGSVTLRIPIQGKEQRDAIIDAARAGREFAIGDIRDEIPDTGNEKRFTREPPT